MASLTKAQLIAANDALRTELNTLREHVAQLNAQLAQGSALVEMLSRPTQRVAAHMPAWQVERAAAMSAAREMAMRTRMVVKA